MRVDAPTWSSSAPAIASVSQQGEVVGLAAGTATILAEHGGKRASAIVTVTAPRVAHVVISPEAPAIEVGTTLQLTATVQSQGGTRLPDRLVTWQVLDSTLATISSSGLVRATSPGTVTVRATSEGVSGTQQLRITRAATSVARVSITPAVTRVVVGDTVAFSATAVDGSGRPVSDQPVEWLLTIAAGNDAASLSNDGVLVTRGPGRVVVQARAEGIVGTQTIDIVELLDPGITVSFGAPLEGATVGDTLIIVADVNHEYPLARVTADVMDVRQEMQLERVGRGALAWVARLDLRLVRFGEHTARVTAIDEQGGMGRGTIRFIRDPVKNKGGSNLPPKNK